MICISFYFKYIFNLDVLSYIPVLICLYPGLLNVKKHYKLDLICDLNEKQIIQLDSIIWKQINYFITCYIKVSFIISYLNKNHTQKFGLSVSGRHSFLFYFIMYLKIQI